MKRRTDIFLALFLLLLTLTACQNKSQESTSKHKVNIVTSTNIYSDIAKQIIGKHGTVKSIISNGNTDPHDFEATVDSAKEVAESNILIANGLGYDDWMNNLAKSNNLKLTKVGEDLMHLKTGDNPHIWYDLAMPEKYVNYLVKRAGQIDPDHKSYFQARAKKYLAKINKIKALAKTINGAKEKQVYVSEPVFDYALNDCHFTIGDKDFEEAVENETDPSAKSVHQMQTEIKEKKVSFFVNNTQASSSTVENFVKLCKQNGIPVLNVRETMPNGVHYSDWMMQNYKKLKEVAK